MVALRMLGHAVLAALVVSLGVLGYVYHRSASDLNAAKQAAIKVGEACGLAVAAGNNQMVKISIPSGYVMRFTGNRVTVDGFSTPEEGLAIDFAGGLPELAAGEHRLLINVKNNKLVVAVIP